MILVNLFCSVSWWSRSCPSAEVNSNMIDDYYINNTSTARSWNRIIILYSGYSYTMWSSGGAVDGLGRLVVKIWILYQSQFT